MSYSNGLIYGNVDVRDVQNALGTTKTDWGALCSHANINPMAKYKPVRHQSVTQLIYTDFLSLRFGMTMPSAFQSNDPNPDSAWIYNRITPGTHPARITDFQDYDNLASSPFAFNVSGELGNSVGAYFFVDSGVNGITNGGKHWRQDTCIKVSELLASGYQNYYLGFCIHDITSSARATVVTNTKLSQLSSTVPYIRLFAKDTTTMLDGIFHPGIGLLDDRDRSGHKFRFIAALFANGPQHSSYEYEVLPSTNTYLVYSLAFAQDIDRVDKFLFFLDTIAGLKGQLTSVTGVSWSYVRSDGQWDEYRLTCNVYGSIMTPSDKWAVSSVGVKVTFNNPGGYVGDSEVTYGTEVQTPNAGTTYSNLLLCQAIGVSVKWPTAMPSAERHVNIFAKATYVNEEVMFENVKSVYL